MSDKRRVPKAQGNRGEELERVERKAVSPIGSKTVYIYVTENIKDRLKDHFTRRGLSVSSGCREIILDWMERNRV